MAAHFNTFNVVLGFWWCLFVCFCIARCLHWLAWLGLFFGVGAVVVICSLGESSPSFPPPCIAHPPPPQAQWHSLHFYVYYIYIYAYKKMKPWVCSTWVCTVKFLPDFFPQKNVIKINIFKRFYLAQFQSQKLFCGGKCVGVLSQDKLSNKNFLQVSSCTCGVS